jgi:hypothetical protein
MFQSAALPLHQQQTGVSVVFRRGSDATSAFTARRSDQVARDPALEIDVTVRQYMLPVSSVNLSGEAIKPRTGDEIVEGDKVFEILPSDGGPPAVTLSIGEFEWHVFTKQTSRDS